MEQNRENEPSAVINRRLMEQTPPGVDNESWQEFRTNYNKAANLEVLNAPAQIDVELNAACNLKCNFCIQSVRDMGTDLLGYECFTKIIDEAAAMGTKSLKLNYMNEPLMVQDLERYIKYAREAGFVNIFMSTNGIMLTERRSRLLIESGITKIFVSLDATTPETYEVQRNSKKFNQIVKNIHKFLEIRNSQGLSYPLIRVNFLKNQANLHELDAFVEQWTGVADMIVIQEMNELIDKDSNLFIDTQKSDYKCSFPFKQLVVDAKKRILPCCCMNGIGLRLGNLNSMTLTEAWNSDKMRNLRELHAAGNYKQNPACRRCIDGN